MLDTGKLRTALMAGIRGTVGCTGRPASRRGRGQSGLHVHKVEEPWTLCRWGCGRQKTRLSPEIREWARVEKREETVEGPFYVATAQKK